ncbi:hypothetical protein QQX09_04730 [Demequina sp. SYSU T00192]|uniref:Lipoprotein n=1 Tax=Demequina litoralis TaxID=3051660 RepID=A0ABT8G7Q9_9MICO|nr:hypothetical protein [Demequina sp. SYSU T00192]MDN4475163.1 hypothetical protein [Demequina sp. SYSU T00192]
MRSHHSRPLVLAVAPAALVLALAACTGSDEPAPTASATVPAPSVTPSAETSATTAPSASASAVPEPSVTATASPQEVAGDVLTGSTPNDFGTVDPEEVFAQTYGGLGEADGVSVEHTVGTTDGGAPLLVVEMAPLEGMGGDTILTFFALWDDAVVQGTVTGEGGITDAQRDDLESAAAAAVHP